MSDTGIATANELILTARLRMTFRGGFKVTLADRTTIVLPLDQPIVPGHYWLVNAENERLGYFIISQTGVVGYANFDSSPPTAEEVRNSMKTPPQPPLTMAAMLDQRFSAAERLSDSLSTPAALAASGHTAETAITELLAELDLLVLEGWSVILNALCDQGSTDTIQHHGFGNRLHLGDHYIDRLNELLTVRLNLIKTTTPV